MKSEIMSNQREQYVENELDVRGLGRALWAGKTWIVGIALLFAAVALIYSFLVKQEWSTTAITDKPTANMLGKYYLQQQFLRNLDVEGSTLSETAPPTMITSDVYSEFTTQLGSYDTRREFWLQTDYYRKRQVGDAKADAALLDELVDKIQYFPRDDKKMTSDMVKLTVETAADANQLARQYVAFASYRTVVYLNAELRGSWQARVNSLQAQVKQQETTSKAVYQRQIQNLERALLIAQQHNLTQTQVTISLDSLPDTELFLLGKPMLEARIAALKSSGPLLDAEYDKNRELLAILKAGPTLDEKFQTYRYLRTPEEPIKRDSPRRFFIMAMWGAVGALVGVGVALVRRIHRQTDTN